MATVKLSRKTGDGTERFRVTGADTAQRYLDAGWELVEGELEAEEMADDSAPGGTESNDAGDGSGEEE